MICPKCSEERAHRSHSRGLGDRLYKWFQYVPYRCHSCDYRFHVFRSGESSPKLRHPEERKIMALRRRQKWQRARLQIGLFAMAGLFLAALLYYMLSKVEVALPG